MTERALVKAIALGLGGAIIVLKGIEKLDNWLRWQTGGHPLPDASYRMTTQRAVRNGGARIVD